MLTITLCKTAENREPHELFPVTTERNRKHCNCARTITSHYVQQLTHRHTDILLYRQADSF